MLLSENLEKKWGKVLDVEGLPKITDPYRRAVTAVILENQQKALAEESSGRVLLGESAPTNATGSSIDNYDPVMISLVRRALPYLIAYDICGVQPMTGPTGLIFAMYSKYASQSGTEALFNEANTAFSAGNKHGNTSGQVAHTGTDPVSNTADSSVYTVGTPMTTAQLEALGDSGANGFAEMAFEIAKTTVTAKGRALKASYSVELAQDLRAIHGLDAETELSNILSSEILAEINREVVRTIYRVAKVGAQVNVTTAGTYDLDTDSNGRWSVERWKGLMFQIEREANAILYDTKRGKGNLLIVSADVASAMSMTGLLSNTPRLTDTLNTDYATASTFAGTFNGMKVYIDPYFSSSSGYELVTIGYKGTSPYDAGLFYCPYVPLQMYRAVGNEGTNEFQPKIGFKTRYGMVANPFATAAGDGVVGDRNTANQANKYYRLFQVKNLQ